MADSETQLLKLDLDNDSFLKKSKESLESIENIGDVENLKGVLSGFESMGMALGVIGVTILALKESFDLVLDAEKIQRVNAQFEMLSNNAGLYGRELKEGIEKAGAGFATTTDLLQASNKAIVELGINAAKIPQIMDMARKVTSVFGGTLIENFDRLSLAISSGNARMLKHMGIIIDTDKAYKTYASSIGKFKDDLTDAEKKTATLNAVLEAQNTSLKGVTGNVKNVTNTWTQFKVMITEVGESISLIWEKIFGKTFFHLIDGAKIYLQQFNNYLKKDMGEGTEQAANKMAYLTDKIRAQREAVQDAQKFVEKHGASWETNGVTAGEALDSSRHKYTLLLQEASKYQAALDKEKKAHEENKQEAAPEETGEKQKVRIKFEADLLKLREDRIKRELALSDTEEKSEALRAEEQIATEEVLKNKLASIDEKYAAQGHAADVIRYKEKEELLAQYEAEAKVREEKMADDAINAANRAAKIQENSFSGFSAGAKAASLSASKDLGNFAKLGEKSFDAFHKNAKSAFIAIGDGSKSAADAMKGFMLNSLADIAEAQGDLLLASALENPLYAAAGAALLVLSGVLRGAAGSAGSSSGVGSSSGGGGGSVATSATDAGLTTSPALTTPSKAVTIQVQGNYFETAATQRALMDMIRSETDATDFKYTQINQGVGQ